MIANPSTWVMLEVGMYLLDANGAAWRVDGKDRKVGQDGWTLRITNKAGQSVDVSRKADEPTTILTPTHEEAEAALVAAGIVAGVKRLVIRMEEYRGHPDNKWARFALANHLMNFHGVSVSPTAHAENKHIEDLLEAHALAHASTTPMVIHHIHVPSQELTP